MSDSSENRRALQLDPDLFFAVKVSAMLKHIGMETTTVRQGSEFATRLMGGDFVIALVNTAAHGVAWQDAIYAARAAGVPIIAYGSHVDTETQVQARAAGASRVIVNSKLAVDLPVIVEQTLQRSTREREDTFPTDGKEKE
ncbi:MAG TPA: hypothetical protein VF792_09175 [Ktedonobacterales bacterium]